MFPIVPAPAERGHRAAQRRRCLDSGCGSWENSIQHLRAVNAQPRSSTLNLQMIARAVRRNLQMHTRPAYAQLLSTARSLGRVWCVPQAELASWWEERHAAALALRWDAAGVTRLVLPSARFAAETESGELLRDGSIVSRDLPAGEDAWRALRCAAPAEELALASELLAHLGYGHLRLVAAERSACAADLLGALATLRESALKHQRFEAAAIDLLRNHLRQLHHAAGLPDLRLWWWPSDAGGEPYRAALSVRFDVDKAIVNLPGIHDLEARYDLRSTVYVRPMGIFYGEREIRRYVRESLGPHEIALHGEFVTTAEQVFGDELAAAQGEKARLEQWTDRPVSGVCMHGGELRSNTTPRTRDAVEAAGFAYETMYRNRYGFPLHLPHGESMRQTLSIGQHYADMNVPGGPQFAQQLGDRFEADLRAAHAAGAMYVPVLHPLYFDLKNYLSYPENVARLSAFLPRFLWTAAKLRRGQVYANRPVQP